VTTVTSERSGLASQQPFQFSGYSQARKLLILFWFVKVIIPFFLIAAAIAYSALNAERNDSLTRCVNGHPVQPLAKFCDECGAPVQHITVVKSP
jgi:hypothetical protein